MNRLSEKVYFSGLIFLWPEITRILNMPQPGTALANDWSIDFCHQIIILIVVHHYWSTLCVLPAVTTAARHTVTSRGDADEANASPLLSKKLSPVGPAHQPPFSREAPAPHPPRSPPGREGQCPAQRLCQISTNSSHPTGRVWLTSRWGGGVQCIARCCHGSGWSPHSS
jgi:hypothetical protein